MPQITFTGDPNENARNPGSLTHLGVTFPLNVAVDVSAEVFDRLKTHSHFTVAGIPEYTPEVQAAAEASFQEIKAVHRGRGSYSIMRGNEEIVQGLTKTDAADFNDMSHDDKADFIEASK